MSIPVPTKNNYSFNPSVKSGLAISFADSNHGLALPGTS